MKEKENKKILFYPSAYSLHTAYESFVTMPPEGYEFIHNYNPHSPYEKYKKNKFLKKLYKMLVKITKKDLSKSIIQKEETPEDIGLVFSMGVLYHGNKPWVLDIIDNPYSLGGYNYDVFLKNKENIETALLDKNCKKIICANESSVKLMKKHFSEDVIKKITLIRPGVPTAKSVVKPKHKDFKILFMGSMKNPEDFYIKGGLETIKVFELLQKHYSDIKLTIRCGIPEEVRGKIEKNPGIELIEDFIPDDEMEAFYLSFDVLSCPSHIYMLMSWLESMSKGLPVIALDTYAASDYIQDRMNGFLVKPSDKIPYDHPSYPVNVREASFIKAIKDPDPRVIQDLYKKFQTIIKDKTLRSRISRNCTTIVKNKFSVEIRNKQVKKLLDPLT